MVNSQNLLTIKAFAEASGRSQQTIYKQISTRLSPYVQEIDGQKYIEHRALKEVFGIDVEQPIQPETLNSFNRGDNPEHPLYVILQKELDAKNKQIQNLQAELAEERKHSREQAEQLATLAAKAQELHAGTIIAQLPSAERQAEAVDEAVDLVNGEENQEPTLELSKPQSGLQEAVRGLSFGQKVRLLFGRGTG